MATIPQPVPLATPPRPLPAPPPPERTGPHERTIWDELAEDGITPEDVADWVARA